MIGNTHLILTAIQGALLYYFALVYFNYTSLFLGGYIKLNFLAIVLRIYFIAPTGRIIYLTNKEA